MFARTTSKVLRSTAVQVSTRRQQQQLPREAARRWSSTYVTLSDLANNKGASKPNVRLGRGWSSTKGGTSGRGHKGQKSRAGNGKPKAGFEGGQTPITRLFPKRGFTNFLSKEYAPLPIHRLQLWIAQGRLDPSEEIDVGAIFRSNLVHGIKGWSGVKLLGEVDPSLPLPPLKLRLSRYSKGAAQAIIDAGGQVTAVYHNALALRQAVHPEKFFGKEVKEAAPTRKTDILYYSNPAKHGYLAGEFSSGPSAAVLGHRAFSTSASLGGRRAFSTSARRSADDWLAGINKINKAVSTGANPKDAGSALFPSSSLISSVDTPTQRPHKPFLPHRPYAPHDLLAQNLYPEQKPYPKPPLLGPSAKASKLSDPFHILGVNPIDEAINTNVVQAYITQMGKIKSRAETGLTWKNQRRVGKMVRRARAMGLVSKWRNNDGKR